MNDDFEKRLQQIAPRQIPPAWREEILAAARSVEASRHAPRTTHHGWFSTIIAQLATITRPQRVAWAGLAGAWMIIFALRFAAQETTPANAHASAPPTPEILQALKQQKRLLAELTDRSTVNIPQRDKITPHPRSISPRSQRPEETVTV